MDILVPRELLESLVDDGDCEYDHNGDCQAHNRDYLEPGSPDHICSQLALKLVLMTDKNKE
jgi:hypothetical protein